MIHQPRQAIHSHHVSLGLFERRIHRADGLRDRNLLSVHARVRRSQPVRDFVQHHGRQITFGRSPRRLRFRHQIFRQRQHDVVHARVHEILEEDFLGALRVVNARIVRQVVRHGLIAVQQSRRCGMARPLPPWASAGRAWRAGPPPPAAAHLECRERISDIDASFALSGSLRISSAAPYEVFTPSTSSRYVSYGAKITSIFGFFRSSHCRSLG